jgi:hypothetical protein
MTARELYERETRHYRTPGNKVKALGSKRYDLKGFTFTIIHYSVTSDTTKWIEASSSDRYFHQHRMAIARDDEVVGSFITKSWWGSKG